MASGVLKPNCARNSITFSITVSVIGGISRLAEGVKNFRNAASSSGFPALRGPVMVSIKVSSLVTATKNARVQRNEQTSLQIGKVGQALDCINDSVCV